MAKPQWQIDIDNAAETAAGNAGKTVGPVFAELAEEAAQLQGVFDGLKLNDEETYNKVVGIVDEAARRNEAIADVVNRIKNLGEAGLGIVNTVEKIASGGALSALRTSLKSKD